MNSDMPQPLSSFGPNLKVEFHPFALDLRMDLARAMAIAISLRSATEHQLGNILARILQTNVTVAMDMFGRLSNFEAQQVQLNAAAAHFLTLEENEVFSCTLNVIGRTARLRHNFAHGVWGVSEDIKDGVLLCDPKVLWNHIGRLKDFSIEAGLLPTANPAPMADRSKIYVWKLKDFREANDRLIRAFNLAYMLGLFVAGISAEERALLQSQLFQVPEIVSEIQRSRRRQHSPKGQQALPGQIETTDYY